MVICAHIARRAWNIIERIDILSEDTHTSYLLIIKDEYHHEPNTYLVFRTKEAAQERLKAIRQLKLEEFLQRSNNVVGLRAISKDLFEFSDESGFRLIDYTTVLLKEVPLSEE